MIVEEHEVYTPQETIDLLKISDSTFRRLVRKGVLRAAKIGGQYRILGKEILRLVSPEVEQQAIKSYLGLKKRVVDTINKW